MRGARRQLAESAARCTGVSLGEFNARINKRMPEGRPAHKSV